GLGDRLRSGLAVFFSTGSATAVAAAVLSAGFLRPRPPRLPRRRLAGVDSDSSPPVGSEAVGATGSGRSGATASSSGAPSCILRRRNHGSGKRDLLVERARERPPGDGAPRALRCWRGKRGHG